MKKLLFFLLFSNLLLSCSDSDEQGILDSRGKHMAELKKALSKNDIPFNVGHDGTIWYSKQYNETVKNIKENINRRFASEVGTKFPDELSTKYFRKLLEERNISFRVETRNNSKWTYWYPENEKQENEIEMEVVSHYFDSKKRKD